MSDVKSINSLIAYLRDKHQIKIGGSSQKRKLRNIGYYHGYKGYRFINNSANKIPYRDFNEILSINDFDMKLKALFYPQIMFIETALKNYVLEEVLEEGNSKSFNIIYANLLTDYKIYPAGSDDYKKVLKKRLDLQNTIYGVLTRDYRNDKILVQHFYHKDMAVPIWAIFEVISLGEFGAFVSCLNPSIRRKISLSLNFNQGCDPQAKLTQNIIYTLKDLRNAVAHNDVIFDTRFRNSNIGRSLITCLQNDTGVTNINFNTIVDYVILVVYMMKNFNVSRTEINKFVSDFEYIIETFRKQIPISIYNRIIHTHTRGKIISLKGFIKK